MKVRELIDRILDEAMRLGQRPHGAYRSYWDIYNPIITFFEGKGLDEYSPDVLKEYSDWVDAKFADGKIKRERHSMLKTAARRVAHYEATGTYLWNVPKRGTRYELDSCYTVLLEEFLASEDFNQNTKGDIEWAARRYFHWLLGQGIREIGKANQDIIQKYLHSCFDEMKPVSVYNVHLYIERDKELEKEGEGEKGTPAPAIYGKFNNVFLSDAELGGLKSELPDKWEYYIDRLSVHIASSGKKYNNHAATIYKWAQEDAEKVPKKGIPDYSYSEGDSL